MILDERDAGLEQLLQRHLQQEGELHGFPHIGHVRAALEAPDTGTVDLRGVFDLLLGVGIKRPFAAENGAQRVGQVRSGRGVWRDVIGGFLGIHSAICCLRAEDG